MNVKEKVRELEDLPEKQLNRELHKLSVEEYNKIINHLAGKIIEQRYESTTSTQ